MKCEKYKELITALIDHEISEKEKQDLTIHLAHCESCREECAQQIEMSKQIRGGELEKMPLEVEDKILSQIAQGNTHKSKTLSIWSGSYSIPRPLAWVAAAALVILALNSFIPRDKSGSKPERPQTTIDSVQTIMLTKADIVSVSTEVNKKALDGRQK